MESATIYGSDCNFNHVVSGGYLYDNSNIGLQEIKKPLTAPPTWVQNLFCTAAPSHIQKMIINNNLLTWVSGNKVIVDTLILNNAGDTLSIQGNDSIVVTSSFSTNAQAGSPIYIKSNNAGVPSNFDFGTNDVCVDYLIIKENNALGTGNHYAGANSINSGLTSGWIYAICQSTPPRYYWVGGTGNWNDVSHWATTSGGTTFYTVPPDSSANPIIIRTSVCICYCNIKSSITIISCVVIAHVNLISSCT